MALNFERLVSRGVARFVSDELDLSGIKMSVNSFLEILIFGSVFIFVGLSAFLTISIKINPGISVLSGAITAALYIFALYAIIEYNIDRRKNFIEGILPDYIQLVAANLRSGISLDKAMLSAARPEFGYFSEDIILMDKQIYSGETMQNALIRLSARYRSRQLEHTMRMMTESIRYGGSMNDLLKQIAKDMRNQAIIQKEIEGQLFLYTIFIAFAVLVGAPSLYALTNKMIAVTDTVWAGILKTNPNGLPSTGIAFLRPTPPSITIDQYNTFSIIAVVMITSLGSVIVSIISNGSIIKGLRYMPIFIAVGLIVFFVVSIAISGIFSAVGTGA